MAPSSSAGTSDARVDTGQLRRALRVIHCLQRERGASGAYYGRMAQSHVLTSGVLATHGGSSQVPLTTARVDTDRALAYMKAYSGVEDGFRPGTSHLDWAATAELTLHKIRNMVDRPTGHETSPSFRRILVAFSTLISSVIHEFVLRYTGGATVLNPQAILNWKNGLKPCSRIHSSGNIHQMLLQAPKPKLPHRRTLSEGDSAPQSNSNTTSNTRKRSAMHYATSDPSFFLFEGNKQALPRLASGELLSLEPLSLTPNHDDEVGEDEGRSTINFDASAEFIEENRERVKHLLILLGIFVQLKESTGVERATLTSVLVFEQQDIGLLVNDVVLEVENQRRQLETLQNHIQPGPMRNLVLNLVNMSPEMRQVQESILGGFSLDGLKEQFNADKLWNVMTVYIDKLHSLELLIVEEIEATRVRVDASPAPNLSGAWRAAFGTSVRDTAEDILRSIEALSPEEVKRRLVSALKIELSVQNESLSKHKTSKGVDDLLSELCNVPASKEWEIDIYELRFLKRIGQGSAGTTYIADWAGLKVAVKVASITEMGLEGWRTEVQALQKLHHPNIIRLLGSVYHPHPLTFCLVLEYCDAGDLQDALLRVTPRNFFFHVANSIVKGMAYLHNRSVIHRDIKPSNVLLSGNIPSGVFQVKVTDFGVATDLNTSRNLTAETGTYRWMSPEVIRHEKYTQTADVYSFAVLVWQLITREEPFADRGQIEAAVAVSMESKRPGLPPGTPPTISGFLAKAWAEDPQTRPSFDVMSEMLAEIEAGLTTDEKRWLEAPLGHHVYNRVDDEEEETEGVEIKPMNLDDSKIPSKSKAKAKDGMKRGKKFSLFSRKSSHF